MSSDQQEKIEKLQKKLKLENAYQNGFTFFYNNSAHIEVV